MTMHLLDNLEEIKTLGDIISFGVIITALLKWIPEITAVLSLVWIIMRLYETYLSVKEKRRTIALLKKGR